MIDIVVLSDLHLGAYCYHKPLQQALFRDIPPSRLTILNGDICHEKRQFSADDLAVMSLLKLRGSLRYVMGNHDSREVAHVFCRLVGAEIFPWCHSIESGGKKFCFIHGHQWDKWVENNSLWGRVLGLFYDWSWKIHPALGLVVKRTSKKMIQCNREVYDGAMTYKDGEGFHAIVCGHTHIPRCEDHYYNAGSWTDPDGFSWLEIDDGKATLKRYSP